MNNRIDRRAFLNMGYGMYIVSTEAEGKANGQIANTVFQVCSSPPLIAAAISKSNLTHEYIQKAKKFSITVLEEETPMVFIGTFGFRSGRVIDKFEKTAHIKGESGIPVVTEHATAVFELKLVDQADAVTHTLFIGEVIRAEVLDDKPSLSYKYYREVIKGKTPVDSSTFIPEEK